MLDILASAPGGGIVLIYVAACGLRRIVDGWKRPAAAPTTPGKGGAAGAGASSPVPALAGPSLVDLDKLDRACPQEFYLPDASLDKLADSFALVQGERLPLHGQLLAAQAAVLRGVFLAQAEGMGSAGNDQGPADLSTAFAGCTLPVAAIFLRFVYAPDHATAGSLAAVHHHTPGLLGAVARLAHRLDGAGLLAKIEAYLQGASADATLPELLHSLQLAESCHLDRLRDTCLALLARKLAGAGPFWHEQVSAAQLAACSSDSLALLATKMANLVSAGPFEPPEVLDIRAGPHGTAGGFTWVVSRFSRQQGRIVSPWVQVGGLEWRIKLWPRGDDAAGGAHLSAYLECNYAAVLAAGLSVVDAYYEFAFMDQGEDGLHYVVDCGSDKFSAEAQNWGKTRMMPLAELARQDRRYLCQDRLAVRITVRVLPPGAARPPPANGQHMAVAAVQVGA